MKRLFDFFASLSGLVVASPILILFSILVWLQDFKSPFYIAPRVAKGDRRFDMVKLRSMVMNADKSGVASTSASDRRITPIGKLIRKLKLDELTQLWNVLWGHMSLVGPRPQVAQDTALYTDEEKKLLAVRPGITDFSSIVFSDEGDILAGAEDPDLRYQQLIRPWKSRLGLFYIEKRSFLTDLRLILLTVRNSVDRRGTLLAVAEIVERLGGSEELVKVCRRDEPLAPHPPPGSSEVFVKDKT
ncbi:MAG: sugar transferase [Pseudomonadota bacterium]